VFTSSRLVYGRPATLPVSESHVLNPASMYAAHKLCCEHYHRIYAASDALTCTIARISNAFGADPDPATKHHGMINVFVRQSLAGRAIELFGDGRQLRDYLYIPDLVSILLDCGTHRAAVNETFNIGSGTGTSLREAAEQVAAATGGPAIRSVPWPRNYEVVETGDYLTDISKVRTRLGFAPRWSFLAGLSDMIAAYCAGGTQP
jgi:UDP-glucose 4-epimerase